MAARRFGVRGLDWQGFLAYLWANHRGKTVGVALGLFFGLFTVIFSFWKAVFIFLVIGLGYYVGDRSDRYGGLWRYVHRLFRER